MLQTGNRWPAGEKRGRKKRGMPKKGECFPAFFSASISPSIIPLSSVGRERKAEVAVAFGGSISGLWLHIKVDEFPGRIF